MRVAHIFNTFKFFADHYEAGPDDHRVMPRTAGDQLKTLKDYGEVFERFYRGAKNPRLLVFLERLAAVDTATVYPFLLEACHTLEELHTDEFERILVWLESYLFRRMICGLTTKQYNRIFIDLIKASLKGGRITEQAVVQFLLKSDSDSARFPTDKEFQEQWVSAPLYKWLAQYKLRAILTALEQRLEDRKSEKLDLPVGLQIEHLMPRKWQDHWPLPLKNADDPAEKLNASQERNVLLHSIGNLTLITSSLNPAISNSAWERKQPEIIKFSKLNLNRYFHDKNKWDENTIVERSLDLLKIAEKIWPYPKVGQE